MEDTFRTLWAQETRAGLAAVESRKPVSPQVCYLCHNLLTLAGVVVSCQDITPDQWVSLPGEAGLGLAVEEPSPLPGTGKSGRLRKKHAWGSRPHPPPSRPSEGILTHAPSCPCLPSLSCPTAEQSLRPASSFSNSVLPSPTPWSARPALPWALQGELQLLCTQLDRHINTHIRESPQAMHRTTLKDLAAQTYIRWQELLAHCQPQVVPPPHPPPGLEGEGSGQLTDQSPQSICPLCSCQAPGWEMGEGSGG